MFRSCSFIFSDSVWLFGVARGNRAGKSGAEWLQKRKTPAYSLMGEDRPLLFRIFALGGTYREALVGARAERSVLRFGRTARMSLGPTSFSLKKLARDGAWGAQLLLSGYHVDLMAADATNLPPPPN